ncbi:MAG: TadE/TadG family type IV pilus assembly protein [Acidimicrobiales bacterium]
MGPVPPRAAASRAAGQHGQATVELALTLPVVVVVLLAVVQVALVARSQILVVDAARAGARAAAVRAGAADAAARRTPGLQAGRLEVWESSAGPGGDVEVRVRYRVRTDVPLVGALVGEPTLESTVTMAVEDEEADPG